MVDLGDSVAAGQLLAQLDTRALASDLRRAQSEEVLAAANRRSASAQTELAANTERRVRALRANGNVSQQAFDEAHLQYRVSRAQLEVAQASLGRAQAAVEAMEVALSEAEIRAPFGGVIQARQVDEGSQIGPGSPALSLVETSKREAHIGIPESAVTSLTVGDAYTIIWQNVSASAQLRSLLPEVNPNTRTVTAVFTVADQRIPLGAVVELSLRQRVPGNGFWVPIDALTAMDRGLWGVFIIDAENIVQQRLVEIVHNEGDRAFVRGLLSTSDRVVATGTQRIVAGQRVIPIAAQMTISAR
jgi:RND family efflux transporter MFP subunit